MGTSNSSDEFKRDAVQQVTVRGYPVREVSRRLGESLHALCKWLGLFAEPAPKARSGIDHEAENRRLKRDLARVTEERDILKRVEPWIATGSRAMANASAAHIRPKKPPREDVFEYIEMFCNPKRKHTNNGILSPVDFEIRQQKLNEAGVQETRGTSHHASHADPPHGVGYRQARRSQHVELPGLASISACMPFSVVFRHSWIDCRRGTLP